MEREILFRGQTRKYGEKVMVGSGEKLPGNWVYGGIFPARPGGCYSIIYTYDPIEKRVVYSDTVGEYIGRTDKNGTKIFEGDILKGAWDERMVVYYDKCYLAFRVRTESGVERDISYYDNGKLEVIGNIHDNPELLNEQRVVGV